MEGTKPAAWGAMNETSSGVPYDRGRDSGVRRLKFRHRPGTEEPENSWI